MLYKLSLGCVIATCTVVSIIVKLCLDSDTSFLYICSIYTVTPRIAAELELTNRPATYTGKGMYTKRDMQNKSYNKKAPEMKKKKTANNC